MTYNGAGGSDAAGWCFVSNPYPSAIDWEKDGWTKSRVENAIYVWDALNSRYTSYVDGVGTNGGSNKIASSQGFWVRSTGDSPVLSVSEPVKSASDTCFYKNNSNVLYVSIAEGNYKSNTALRFGDEFTESYDIDRDAYYWGGTYPVNIGTVNDEGSYFSINSLPETGGQEIPLYIQHKNDKNKEFTILFDGVGAVGENSYLLLTDKYKNETVVIEDDNTVFNFKYDGNSLSNGGSRFVLIKKEREILSLGDVNKTVGSYVYPTTVSQGGTLNISVPATDDFQRVEIFNLNGNVLYTSTTDRVINLDVSFQVGTYLVRIITGRGVYTEKVIVN